MNKVIIHGEGMESLVNSHIRQDMPFLVGPPSPSRLMDVDSYRSKIQGKTVPYHPEYQESNRETFLRLSKFNLLITTNHKVYILGKWVMK